MQSMGTILDYLREYGDYTLWEKPFSDVDSLVLCQFAYLKFDGMVPGPGEGCCAVGVRELAEHVHYDHLYGDERYRKDNTALFQGIYKSRRFGDMKLWNYVNQIEPDQETQFSAVVCGLPGGVTYVAFRGTDESIVGWKEDLNLAFSKPVPGQILSVQYLEQAARTIAGGFYVGGHSKGGNLAVYASMNCSAGVRERIERIYDHDGPGFRPEVREKGAFAEIAGRIRKTVPRSSLVGMLLYTEENYTVVESKTIGLAQHNPYTWLVKEDAFLIVKDIRTGRKFMDKALNQWILSLSPEEMHTFVDTFYQVILASETDNLIDLTANWMKSLHRIRMALKEIAPETEKAIWQIMRALLDIISANMKERFRNRNETEREKLEEAIRQLESAFRKQP